MPHNLASFVCWVVLFATPTFAVCGEKPDRAELQKITDGALARVKSPGVSTALVVDNELVFASGAGFADLEQDVPATSKTKFRIGSISKPIAAVAVMQLVEAGKVNLDDSIHDYVPSFPVKDERPIRVREILNHTSGIRHYKDDEFLHDEPHETLESAIGIFKDDPLLFKSGERFSYTTYGFNLLAGVVEQASGQPFEEYLRERVWSPAEMVDTQFDRVKPLIAHRARPYERRRNGEFENSPYVDLSIKWAGGGMLSSAEDLARFFIALNTDKLMSERTRRIMHTPQVATNRGDQMALGWFVSRKKERVAVYHGGGSVGGTTLLLTYPSERVAAIVLSNCSDSMNLRAVADDLVEAAVPEPVAAAASE